MIPFIWNVQAVKFTDTESRLEVAKSCGEVQRMIDKGCVVSFYDNENVVKLGNSDGCTTLNVLKMNWIYPL